MQIILSRTDSIGDVVLTLPMAGALKQAIPDCKIIFLGREYTRPVAELCSHIDEFVSWPPTPTPTLPSPIWGRVGEGVIIHVFPDKEICFAAKKAGIPLRIATAGRWYTWLSCNRLLHIPRKHSDLHESQLNLKMLSPLGIDRDYTLEEIAGLYGFPLPDPPHPHPTHPQLGEGLGRGRIILHPKSKGSAREWGLDNYSRLVGLLPEAEYEILITGTKEEGMLMASFLEKHRGRVTDLTGKLTLKELINLIASSDALVAASTGPLHLAAALGIRAVGLYAPMRPIFPQRWAPVGKNATWLALDKTCNDCRKTMDCRCIRSISPESVVEKLVSKKTGKRVNG
jgi:ADP-heptose:LPS heptosyltransferase